MMTTIAEGIIVELRRVFVTHGLPKQLVLDNGAQFTSDTFQQFLKENGIKMSVQHHTIHPLMGRLKGLCRHSKMP